MSTSVEREVALHYSENRENRVLFEIRVGKTSIGADVSFLSQAPGEKEILYPPFTYLEVLHDSPAKRQQGVHAGVRVITLQLTVNQHFHTYEEVLRARKEELLELCTSLEWVRAAVLPKLCKAFLCPQL